MVLTAGQDIEIYIKTVQSLKIVAEQGPGGGKAQQTVAFDVAELYLDAAEVYGSFCETIKSIGKATGAKTEVAPVSYGGTQFLLPTHIRTRAHKCIHISMHRHM